MKLSEVGQPDQGALEEAKVAELVEGKVYLILVERNTLPFESCVRLRDELGSVGVKAMVARVDSTEGVRVFTLERGEQ